MTKEAEVLQKLREALPPGVPKHTIRWPEGISLPKGLDDGTGRCRMELSSTAIVGNMQTDAAAFEGWALVLKTWLGTKKHFTVELAWKDPGKLEREEAPFGHYQRFLYRVIRFAESVSWFTVEGKSARLLNASLILPPSGRPKEVALLFNSGDPRARKDVNPSDPLATKEFKELTEHEAEMWFCRSPRALLASVAADGAALHRQFPVGIFEGVVTEKTAVFTRGKSALDLWAVNEDRAMLFELKKPVGEKKVGAVSELLFYTHVIRDLQLNLFNFRKPSSSELDLISSKKVEGYLLLGEGRIHPLLNCKNVFEELNTAFKPRKCLFGVITYNRFECNKIFP